jgi:HlyD family secretion protein
VVFQIRLNAISTQNVVTYTVVVNTKNDDLRLLPYLTADVKFDVDRRSGVLMVPNGALRWQPQTQEIHPDVRDTLLAQAAQDTKDSKGNGPERSRADKAADGKAAAGNDSGPAKPGSDAIGVDANKDKGDNGKGDNGKGDNGKGDKAAKDGKPTKGHKKRDHRGMIWVKDGNYVRPVEVRVGATDGTNTEVSGSAVKEDMEVVLGEIRNDRPADTTNPFAPKIFRGKSASPSQNPNQGGK